jgi:hypothetical protein
MTMAEQLLSTRELIENQTKFRRPKVRDLHQPVAADILEKRKHDNRLWEFGALPDDQVEPFPCNHDCFKRLSNILHDYGRANYTYNENLTELKLLRYIDHDLESRFLLPLKDEEKRLFGNYIAEVNKLVEDTYSGSISRTKERIASAKAHQKEIDQDLNAVQNFHTQQRKEQKLIAAKKNKPARVFTKEEEARGLHWSTFAESDLSRSKENLLNKKIDLKKQIKNLEKEINKLDGEINSFAGKAEECEVKMEDEQNEDAFRDLKLSSEFNRNQIERLKKKLLPLSVENSEHYIEVENIDKQLKLLDVLIDKEALLKDVKINFPRRRERLLFRFEKLLREQTEIETLRVNLNTLWKEISGDSQELIGPLGLRTDAKLYFI